MAFAATARPGVEVEVAAPNFAGQGHDQDLASKILRKRQEELARRSRLLDPRKRNGGVDHAVLASQVAEKAAIRAAQAEEDLTDARNQDLQRQVLQTVEGIKHQAARERQKDAINYSLAHHGKETRREYALSDPNALRRELPPGASGEQLGPAAMVGFEGDTDPVMRKKMQAELQSEWLLQQVREKSDRAVAERALQDQHDSELLMANAVRAACEAQEIEEARQEKCDEAAENLQLAAQHRARREARKQRDVEQQGVHVANVTGSERLNETHDYKVSQFGRLVTADYKRMTVEEEQDVHDTRARQILESQAKRQNDAVEDAQYAHGILRGVAVLGALEQEKERQQKERLKQMVAHNQSLAASKRQQGVHDARNYRAFE